MVGPRSKLTNLGLNAAILTYCLLKQLSVKSTTDHKWLKSLEKLAPLHRSPELTVPSCCRPVFQLAFWPHSCNPGCQLTTGLARVLSQVPHDPGQSRSIDCVSQSIPRLRGPVHSFLLFLSWTSCLYFLAWCITTPQLGSAPNRLLSPLTLTELALTPECLTHPHWTQMGLDSFSYS